MSRGVKYRLDQDSTITSGEAGAVPARVAVPVVGDSNE